MTVFNFLGDLASTVFYELLLSMDAFLYKFFGWLYSIYLQIANVRLLTDQSYQDISNRIYVVVGILALFMVAYAILQNIISPDDKKGSNGMAILKRVVIAFIAIFLVPSAFQFVYGLQNSVLSGNVIGNIINPADSTGNDSYDMSSPVVYEDEDGSYYYICEGCDSQTNVNDCDSKILVTLVDDYKTPGVCYGKDIIYYENENFDLEVQSQQTNGNYMAYSIMEGFFRVKEGIDPDEVEPDLDAFIVSSAGSGAGTGALIVGGFMCVAAGIGAVVSAGATVITWGTAAPVLVGTLSTAAVACGQVVVGAAVAGALVGGLIGGVVGTYEYITEDNYTWSQVKTNVIYDGDFEYIIPFASNIGNEIEYMPFVSTLAIGFTIYMLLNFIIDLAVRTFKLAFYQIIAPIPIFMSILPSNEKVMNQWVKITLSTYFEVFIRVAALSFIPFFVSLLQTVKVVESNLFLKAILIMGAITFAKQAPKLISDITGIKTDGMKLGLTQKLADGGVFAAGSLGYANTAGFLRRGVTEVKKYNTLNKKDMSNKDKAKAIAKGFSTSAGAGFKSTYHSALHGNALKAKNMDDLKTSGEAGYKKYSANVVAKEKRKNRYMRSDENRLTDAVDAGNEWLGINKSYEEYEEYKTIADRVSQNKSTVESSLDKLLNDADFTSNAEVLKAKMDYINKHRAGHTGQWVENKASLAALRNYEAALNNVTDEQLSKGYVMQMPDGTTTAPITTRFEFTDAVTAYKAQLEKVENQEKDWLMHMASSADAMQQMEKLGYDAGPMKKAMLNAQEDAKIHKEYMLENLATVNKALYDKAINNGLSPIDASKTQVKASDIAAMTEDEAFLQFTSFGRTVDEINTKQRGELTRKKSLDAQKQAEKPKD